MKACLLESLALFCPNANSFRRFQANSYAPLAPTWGINNRTVSLRVPGGPPSSRHIEHRICGADANPYLAAAALPRRCAWVFASDSTPVRRSLATLRSSHRRCRATAAAARAGGSAWAREALGEDFLKIYLAIKQAEYRAFMGEVGEQDWRWYLNQA